MEENYINLIRAFKKLDIEDKKEEIIKKLYELINLLYLENKKIDSFNVPLGILNDYNAERYYMDFLETYKNIPEAVTLYGEQRELFEDFFEKVMGSCEIVKMRN